MNTKPSETKSSEYEYDGQLWLLSFIWITLNNVLLYDESWVIKFLILAGILFIFGIYRYIRGRSYKMYWIMSIPAVGLAILSLFEPELPFPGRTFFVVIVIAAILFHLWLFWKVGNIFHKRSE